MTDKALEAALEAGFRKGADEFQPDPEMFVCMDTTGCYHVSWDATEHQAKMASLKSTHEAHYVLSALLGEAEVVATAWEGYWPGAGSVNSVTRVTTDRRTAEAWASDGAEVTPLASLQAMQARAEKAERERDEASQAFKALIVAMAQAGMGAGDKGGGGIVIKNRRAEAAEALVKELEEALEPFAAYIEARDENDSDFPDDASVVAYARNLREAAAEVTAGDFRRARAVLSRSGSTDEPVES